MNKAMKMVIITGLVIVVGIIIAVKQHGKTKSTLKNPEATVEAATVSETQSAESEVSSITEQRPTLVDLGAGKCIPCKMMAPILEELKETYAARLEVVFIDVWENPDEAKKYDIRMIPTQIFYDASGKELFRHEGFYSQEDILTKWKELGIALQTGS